VRNKKFAWLSAPSAVARLWIRSLGAMALSALAACSDLVHSNPFDPASTVDVTIAGPDTLFSVGQLGQYTIQSVPSFTDPTAAWSASDGTILGLEGAGSFQLLGAPLFPATRSIQLSLSIGLYYLPHGSMYRRSFSRSVTVTQRLVSIKLRCPDTHACGAIAVGSAWSVWVDGADALGSQISGLTDPAFNPTTGTPIATFVVRDTTIATASPVGVRVATVVARRTGTTWIVASRGLLTDSLQLVVR
jgi:hypothetical protein